MSDDCRRSRPKRSFTCTCGGKTIPGKGLCPVCLEREARLDQALSVGRQAKAKAEEQLKHDTSMAAARRAIDEAADRVIAAQYSTKHTPLLPFSGAKKGAKKHGKRRED